jgi:hypothetical protein
MLVRGCYRHALGNGARRAWEQSWPGTLQCRGVDVLGAGKSAWSLGHTGLEELWPGAIPALRVPAWRILATGIPTR